MARKNASTPNNNSWAQVTFVSIRLTGKHKETFRHWMERPAEQIALDVAAFMSNGHKTSISWDEGNTCWIVASTCKEESSKNFNHCISSRSNEWYEALAMNVYKTNIMANGGAWIDQQEDSDWG